VTSRVPDAVRHEVTRRRAGAQKPCAVSPIGPGSAAHHFVDALRPWHESYTAGFGSPAMAQAARSVFTSRQATVIWPTPPGTGVIAPATVSAS